MQNKGKSKENEKLKQALSSLPLFFAYGKMHFLEAVMTTVGEHEVVFKRFPTFIFACDLIV